MPSWITEAFCKAVEQGCSNHALDKIKSNSEKRIAILHIASTLMHSPSHLTNSDHFTSSNSKKKVLNLSQHISSWKICINRSFCNGRNWFESDWLIFVLFVCCLKKKLFSVILWTKILPKVVIYQWKHFWDNDALIRKKKKRNGQIWLSRAH